MFDVGLSPYVSYATSFTPNLGADSAGKSFRPTTGEGAEVGVKFKPNGSNFMITAALFDIRQKDVLTADPANFFFNVQTDAVRVRGFELELKGNLTRELEIVAGYSHLDPRVTSSIAGYAGKYMINTAQDQGAIWGKYTWYDGPLAGLGLGAGVRYVGETYGDNFNTFVVPSYAVADAATIGLSSVTSASWQSRTNSGDFLGTAADNVEMGDQRIAIGQRPAIGRQQI